MFTILNIPSVFWVNSIGNPVFIRSLMVYWIFREHIYIDVNISNLIEKQTECSSSTSSYDEK